MIDDHATPPTLKGKNLEELHKERLASKPDAWTYAWLKQKFDEMAKGYLGACHGINLAVVNVRENRELVLALEKRIEAVERENQMLMARIGEMQAEAEATKKRIDEMANWAARIQKDVRRTGDPSTTE